MNIPRTCNWLSKSSKVDIKGDLYILQLLCKFTFLFVFNIHVNLLPEKFWRNVLGELAKKPENFVGL